VVDGDVIWKMSRIPIEYIRQASFSNYIIYYRFSYKKSKNKTSQDTKIDKNKAIPLPHAKYAS